MGLCQKIRSYYDLAGMFHVSSIFIGGGTPSILETQQMRSIFDAIRATFPIDSDAEITVEVNPGTVDRTVIHGEDWTEIRILRLCESRSSNFGRRNYFLRTVRIQIPAG